MENMGRHDAAAGSLLDSLMECLAALDRAGAHLAASHLDAAIHAYRDFLVAQQHLSETEQTGSD